MRGGAGSPRELSQGLQATGHAAGLPHQDPAEQEPGGGGIPPRSGHFALAPRDPDGGWSGDRSTGAGSTRADPAGNFPVGGPEEEDWPGGPEKEYWLGGPGEPAQRPAAGLAFPDV